MATMKQPMPGKTISMAPGTTAFYGALAGMMEALVCHPLDTIKVNMQTKNTTATLLSQKPGDKTLVRTIQSIYRQAPMAFYRGLGAVLLGIVPKMAIRFTSFETYKTILKRPDEKALTSGRLILAGLAAGITEAVLVVTPTEVLKIRLQTTKPRDGVRGAVSVGYRNTPEALYTIVRTEGVKVLWTGIGLTAARQGTNQAVNFFAYTRIRQALVDNQPQYHSSGLPSWQTGLNGFLAGSLGPLANAPIDTLKTRIQKSGNRGNESGLSRLIHTFQDIVRHDGYRALYKGILPRVLRVGIGQAVTFSTYEALRRWLS
ncbi:hypothetical protein ACN38_g10473 [Penicillium nordicum]|uniref:Uncharacterized protein n=1 Tax=Penicillium nordicum TaxID=229535 RepID=A0A0M8P1U6_9EURO|nr:hypothetical protein ACN38_g10473 [Penicillium nordicum]